MSYVGRYINMDASVGRRAAIEGRLQGLGLGDRYTRFSAIDGRGLIQPSDCGVSAGELGCFVSHHRCIAEAAMRERPTHIIEDDVIFAAQTAPIVDQILAQCLAQWDMVFLNIITPFHFNTVFNLLRLWREAGMAEPGPDGARSPRFINYLGLESIPFTGASSYLLSPKGAAKLEARVAEHLARGPTMPIDNLFQHLVNRGEITAACTVPFLTSVDPAEIASTTISERTQDDMSSLAFFLMRNHFFIGRDDRRTKTLSDDLAASVAGGEDLGGLLQAFGYILSDRFVNF